MRVRLVPLLILVAAVAGAIAFSRGLRVVDTVGMLACSAIAGGATAALAKRKK